MNKRIISLRANGDYLLTNHVLNMDGKVQPVANSDRADGESGSSERVLTNFQKIQLLPFAAVLKESAYKQAKAEAYNMTTIDNSPAMATIRAAKTTGAEQQKTTRLETANTSNGTTTVTLSINNTGTAEVLVPVFDASGFVSSDLGLTQLPATVIVGGTHGTLTLTALRNLVTSMAVEVTETVYQVSDAAMINNSLVRFIGRDISKSPVGRNENYDFSANLDAGQFNPTIQKDRKHYLVNNEQAVLYRIPAAKSLTITFRINSKASAYNMVQA